MPIKINWQKQKLAKGMMWNILKSIEMLLNQKIEVQFLLSGKSKKNHR